MNESEFEHEGKRYRAEEVSECVCTGCAFYKDETCRLIGVDGPVVDCFAKGRKDGNHVIFVEVKP